MLIYMQMGLGSVPDTIGTDPVGWKEKGDFEKMLRRMMRKAQQTRFLAERTCPKRIQIPWYLAKEHCPEP